METHGAGNEDCPSDDGKGSHLRPQDACIAALEEHTAADFEEVAYGVEIGVCSFGLKSRDGALRYLVRMPPYGRGFSKHEGLPIRCGFFEEAQKRSGHPPCIVSMSPPDYPQPWCVPQCRFARQNYSGAAPSAANFRVARFDWSARAAHSIADQC